MNVLKNMEIIFVASVVLLCATDYAGAEVRTTPVIDAGSIKMVVVDGVKMPVVTISAKRAR
jgi:hypothetical protein